MQPAVRALTIGALSLALVGLPGLPERALREMHVTELRVPLALAAEPDEDGAWVSAPLEGETTIAGLTWDDPTDAPDGAEVRVLVDGDWTGWESVEVDDEHAPDPGSNEDSDGRGGTAPIVVEGADAVQFRITDADTPGDLTAELIDVDDPDGARRVRQQAGAADAATARPAIHTRADWNSTGCTTRDPATIEMGPRAQVLFVHHTTGYTSYAQGDVAGIMRAICSYHVNGRKWDDIGYNALIDRYGGIWEGREGGLEETIIGAHTGGFNTWSSGVALIGDHENGGAPTAEAQAALVRYAAWKMDVHNINPLGRSTIVSAGSSKWPEGKAVELRSLSGHRDGSSTSCPGRSCFALLDEIAGRVDEAGGMRIFGGWAQAESVQLDEAGRWPALQFDLAFSEMASWTFELRDQRGNLVLRRQGQGSSASITWDSTVNGARAGRGEYSTHVEASNLVTREAASPSDHTVVLGSPIGEFLDVPEGSVFAADIAWLAERGITYGCNPPDQTKFCPDRDVTRAQMAAFLSRALSLPDAPHTGFRDVPASHPFAKDIARLAQSGITRGCTDDGSRFCPDASVTRAQMAAFLVRGLRLRASNHPGFADVPRTNQFREDIARFATAGVTRGCNPPDNTRFCPDASVTRAQMAAFLRRGLS